MYPGSFRKAKSCLFIRNVENKWATFQDGTGKAAFPAFAEPTPPKWLWLRRPGAATRLRAEALQRASAQAGRPFAVLTYAMYAPRVKQGLSPSGYPKPFAAFSSTGSGHGWTDFFGHSLQLMMAVSSWACICHGSQIFNSPSKILEVSRNIQEFPLIGRVVPELDDENIRERFVYSYRLVLQHSIACSEIRYRRNVWMEPNLTLVDNIHGQVCQTEHKHVYLLIQYVYGDCHENQINRYN